MNDEAIKDKFLNPGITKFTDGEHKVDWALGIAYKKAVKLRGITSWGNFTPEQKRREELIVEDYQIRIAALLLEEVR